VGCEWPIGVVRDGRRGEVLVRRRKAGTHKFLPKLPARQNPSARPRRRWAQPTLRRRDRSRQTKPNRAEQAGGRRQERTVAVARNKAKLGMDGVPGRSERRGPAIADCGMNSGTVPRQAMRNKANDTGWGSEVRPVLTVLPSYPLTFHPLRPSASPASAGAGSLRLVFMRNEAKCAEGRVSAKRRWKKGL